MEKMISSQEVFHGKIVTVKVDTVEIEEGPEKGKKTRREVVVRPDTVSAVALDEEENLLLVKQYRYSIGAWTLEIPAGTIDKGESAEEAMHRELREETGFDCRELTVLTSYHPAIGYSTETMTIFLAKNLFPSPLKGDEAEIHVVRMSLREAAKAIISGKSPFADAKSNLGVILAAYTLACRRLPDS